MFNESGNEKRNNNKIILNWIGFIASIVTIFSFITGVHNILSLMKIFGYNEIITIADIQPKKLFWTIFISIFLLFFPIWFILMRSIRNLFFNLHLIPYPNPAQWFCIIFFFFFGNLYYCAYIELFLPVIHNIIKNTDGIIGLFVPLGIVFLGGNALTIASAFYHNEKQE